LIGDYDSVQIEYYDSSTKKIIKVPKLSHSGRIVLTLKYLSNGYVASSTDDSNVNVWDPKTWSSKHLYKGHTSAIWCMDQIDEDTIVSGSDDGTIHIWKIRTGLTLKRIPVGRRVFTVKSILNSFQIACGLYDSNDLRIYNYSSGDLVQTLNGHTNWVLSVEALNQQYIASGDANNFVFIWDLETHSIRYKLTEHSGWVYCLKLLSSSLLASADAEGLIIIWNWLQGTLVHKLQGHNNAVHFSSLDLYDNQTLISGSWDSTIKLWNISNGSLIETITTDIEINTLTILKGNN
jgi:WD40 repeat protein